MAKTLFETLREGAQEPWLAYTRAPFLLALRDGTLPQATFQAYLLQDYLFLKHAVRAYALAGYKAATLQETAYALAGASSLLREMELHQSYCAAWGITPEKLAAVPEGNATIAYTRYVLDVGMQGDFLDILTVLAPCIVGYHRIATALQQETTAAALQHNPYASWIALYAGDDYEQVAEKAIHALEAAWNDRRSPADRLPRLQEYFTQATWLEAAFWPDHTVKAACLERAARL
jgi:thiaminase (transcriptional activator TenA)